MCFTAPCCTAFDAWSGDAECGYAQSNTSESPSAILCTARICPTRAVSQPHARRGALGLPWVPHSHFCFIRAVHVPSMYDPELESEQGALWCHVMSDPSQVYSPI